jgi:hypothetical protein
VALFVPPAVVQLFAAVQSRLFQVTPAVEQAVSSSVPSCHDSVSA